MKFKLEGSAKRFFILGFKFIKKGREPLHEIQT